ncbi:MAG TPA: cadherin-like beta sandwich domain-containing protein, partial [Coriobacteriia bacterium]|nr:cadherin-like beta sandwich domain-containing protein [Coriobacteriia bacterium]
MFNIDANVFAGSRIPVGKEGHVRKPSIRMLAVLVALGSLAGCFSFGRGHGPVDAFQFLASRNPTLGRNVTGAMNENADPVEITVVVPPSVRSLDLVATFSLNTEALITVVSSGRPVSQENGVSRNDFSAPVIYSLQVPGEKQPWRYRVSVRYAQTDATLSQITIPEGYAMSPLFSPKVKSYTVEVPWSVRKVRIEARGQSRNMQDIVIDGAGSGGSSASVTVDFSSGLSRPVSIETLAEDGETRDTYTVTLRRLSADANAKLASLEI